MLVTWLFLLFVLVPTAELVVLIRVGSQLGLPLTLAVILVTGAVGAWLARQQGVGALRRLQDSLGAGRMPTDELVDGGLILAAGLLLITPGFLTDAVGFVLLVPPLRRQVRRLFGGLFRRSIEKHVRVHTNLHRQKGGTTAPNHAADEARNQVIDVDAEPVERRE